MFTSNPTTTGQKNKETAQWIRTSPRPRGGQPSSPLALVLPGYAIAITIIIAINTNSGYTITRHTHHDATSAAGGWTCLAGTRLACNTDTASDATASAVTTHRLASRLSITGRACRISYAAIGYATLAYPASPAFGHSIFRTDPPIIAAIPITAIHITAINITAIPIVAIVTAVIATANEGPVPRRLGFMSTLPETVSP
jgi:hypothetical protein